MLDMGFAPDLNRIMQRVPRKRQTLLFSATMPGEIRKLAATWLTDPAEVRDRAGRQDGRTDRRIGPVRRRAAEADAAHPLAAPRPLGRARWSSPAPSIGPTRSPNRCSSRASRPTRSTPTRANRPGSKALARFKSSKPPVLVATDIAARGSTSTPSRTSSISICRSSRPAISTASAAPAGPARRASPSRFAPGPSGRSCERSSG